MRVKLASLNSSLINLNIYQISTHLFISKNNKKALSKFEINKFLLKFNEN